VFTADEQIRALSAVLQAVGITGLAANFLLLVARNRRLFAVRDMVRAYRALVARHKGEVAAEVITAVPLREDQLAALKEALKSVTKQEVQIDLKVDPAIIGGLIVKVGSRMVDSSLRTKLNAMKQAMKEAG
jgi:F-type H+-transporting ATPase subunit delta